MTIRLLLALAFGVATAHGALQWEATERTPPVALGAEKVEVAYPFKNAGQKPLTILSVRASCGCTTPALEKMIYAPGESGEVKASFHIGDRVGDQHSVIYVQTDEPDAAPLQLHLYLSVPQPLEITPRVVSWEQNEAPAPKTIDVHVHPESGVELTGVQTTDGGYLTEVKPQPEKGHYLVEIRPTGTAAKSRAVFHLQTSKALAKPYPIFAFVR